MKDRLAGGIWGHLIGDAMGVPYEFMISSQVRDVRWGAKGTHRQPPGTWSDDGALMLALLDSLLSAGFDLEDQGRRALEWFNHGAYTPGGRFDVGNTTASALRRLESGVPAAACGGAGEHDNGNGSLMRILPIALVYANAPPAAVVDHAMASSALTHRHPRAQVTCALYCIVAQCLLHGAEKDAALTSGFDSLEPAMPASHRIELEALKNFSHPQGTGYVIDTFWSAWEAFSRSSSYQETIERAIRYGNDTDTTAAIAGGLAGIFWRKAGFPQEWLANMRGKEIVEPLIERLVRR